LDTFKNLIWFLSKKQSINDFEILNAVMSCDVRGGQTMIREWSSALLEAMELAYRHEKYSQVIQIVHFVEKYKPSYQVAILLAMPVYKLFLSSLIRVRDVGGAYRAVMKGLQENMFSGNGGGGLVTHQQDDLHHLIQEVVALCANYSQYDYVNTIVSGTKWIPGLKLSHPSAGDGVGGSESSHNMQVYPIPTKFKFQMRPSSFQTKKYIRDENKNQTNSLQHLKIKDDRECLVGDNDRSGTVTAGDKEDISSSLSTSTTKAEPAPPVVISKEGEEEIPPGLRSADVDETSTPTGLKKRSLFDVITSKFLS
jgi:hypothetical protein